jgi:hypothetical protein
MKDKQLKVLTIQEQQTVSGGSAFNLDPFYQPLNQLKMSFGNELETLPKAYITLGLHEDGGTLSTF